MRLSELETGTIATIINTYDLPLRLLELGILKGKQVKVLKKQGNKGPLLISTEDTNLVISKKLAEKIKITTDANLRKKA